MVDAIAQPSKPLFRIIDPAYPRNNIYRFAARKTISLGPVLVATTAHRRLDWLDCEVISENNYRVRRRGAPCDENGLPDHAALQRERPATFLGLSASITNAAPRAAALVRQYRSMPAELRPAAIIVGGWHAGDRPEEFLEAGADVVVHGEGVAVIAQLLDALLHRRSLADVPGISYREDGRTRRNGPEFLAVSQEELDALPDPNFDLVRFANIKVFPVSRTWGCSGRCRFCRVRQAPRSLSPARFAQQLKILISKGHRHVFVVDDRVEEDLQGFRAWLAEVADFREQRKITTLDLTVQARLSLAAQTDVLELMRRSGVRTVAIGYESPIPEELGAMRKPIVPKMMLEWTRVWKRFGFYVHAMLIFGYPVSCRQRPVDQQQNALSARQRAGAFWRFLKQARPDTIQILLLTPLPGTEDWDFLERSGRILKQLGWSFWDGLHAVFKPDAGASPQQLQRELVKLHRKFYGFRWLGGCAPLALMLHLAKIGFSTVSMPFIWFGLFLLRFLRERSFRNNAVMAWQRPARLFRNACRHFQAYLIVNVAQKELREFERRLDELTTG